MQNSAEEVFGEHRTLANLSCILCTSSCKLCAHPYICFYTIYHVVLFLLFTEIIFALWLATRHHVTSASASLNVTSHLWLRPVLLIAWQLKCEGSKWEDKYKSAQARRLSQTKARSSPSLSSLSSPLTSKVKKRQFYYVYFFLITFTFPSMRRMTLEAFLFAETHAHY